MLSPRGASEIVYKLVESAAANAENNLDMARDTLYVAEIYADGGPTLKRYRPRAQGQCGQHFEAHEPHYRHLGSG